MSISGITINGGTTVNGGVTLKAAPSIMIFHQDQVIDFIDPSVLTVNGFIQSGSSSEILLQLNTEQLDYINNLSGPPTSYILFEGNWGSGSTDHSPNTAFVLFPTGSWEYSIFLPLGSLAFNEYSVYEGNWNWPFTALTLIDWG